MLKPEFNKKVAILGGAGPWASAYAHTKLIRLSQWDYGAIEDQEYPEILHHSIPLKGFGSEGIIDRDIVRKQLMSAFDLFNTWGADIALIACNSLHSFYDDVKKRSDINIVHLPNEGADALQRLGIQRAGILCSESSLHDELHKTALNMRGIEAILPTREQQDKVNHIIEVVMAGDSTVQIAQDFRQLGREFQQAGAQAIISGCTELSYLSTKVNHAIPAVDCLDEALVKTLELAAGPK